MTRRIQILLGSAIATAAAVGWLAVAVRADEVFLFTSFRGNGEEGLRLLTSEDGLAWAEIPGTFLKPAVGGKLMRDPSLVRGPGGAYHLAWTTAWRGDKGFGYARSTDLLNWSEQKFVPAMEHEPATVNVWAPELFFDDEARQFIICWASTIPGRFPDNGEPHDNNQRMYYTTTRDFETFAPTKLFCEPGFSVIDGTIVKDASRYVLVLKENSRSRMKLRVAFGESATGPWADVSEPFTAMYTEGPTVAKLGDEWFIYYDAYRARKYGAAKTRDFHVFEDASAAVSFPEGHKHGTVLRVPRRDVERLQAAKRQPVVQTAAPAADDAEAAYTRTITERAEKIVATLELDDAAKRVRVRDALVSQYRALREIHDGRDAALATAKSDSADDQRSAAIKRETAEKLLTRHRRFVAVLGATLSPADVDRVKDGLTYGVAPITYRGYLDMLPDLSDEEKAEVLAQLLEAREYAMDGGSSEEKHAIFGKYKGRINNYLSKAGYDLKQAEKDWAARRKAAARTNTANTTP